MATFYEANLRLEHYDTFKGILDKQIPDTFSRWEWEQMKSHAQPRASGDIVVEVETDPNEFVRYCDSRNRPRNMDSLRELVYAKGVGQKY